MKHTITRKACPNIVSARGAKGRLPFISILYMRQVVNTSKVQLSENDYLSVFVNLRELAAGVQGI